MRDQYAYLADSCQSGVPEQTIPQSVPKLYWDVCEATEVKASQVGDGNETFENAQVNRKSVESENQVLPEGLTLEHR